MTNLPRLAAVRLAAARLVVVGLALFASPGSAADFAQLDNPNDAVLRFAIDLRKAVLAKDTRYLDAVLHDAGGYDEQVERFIYSDDFARSWRGKRGRSVATILADPSLGVIYEGSVETSIETSKGLQYTLYFYTPVPNYDFMSVAYLVGKRDWMIDYVACRAERRGDSWMLLGSFCFNDTDRMR